MLLLIFTGCSTDKPNDKETSSNYMIRYLNEVQEIELIKESTLILINNLGCNACREGALIELSENGDYLNSKTRIILLAKKDSSFVNFYLKDCGECEILYDKGKLSKYGLMYNYPKLYKIKGNKVTKSIRFTGRNFE